MIPHQHRVFRIDEPSRVGEARRAALRMGADEGFDDETNGRVAIVVTELGTNLNRHAQRGRILLAAGKRGDRRLIEVVSMDGGPGMVDVNACLRDGYSTSGTPGTGLGAVQRQADEFSLFSRAGLGTVVCARVGTRTASIRKNTGRFEIAGISVPVAGETVCGDAWASHEQGDSASVMVADGLGHGWLAAKAAQAAVTAFEARAPATPSEVIVRSHAALRATRGAAVAVASLDAAKGTIVFAGAGNVSGRVLTATADRALLSQNGTAGLQISTPREVEHEWPAHGILVLFSDGLLSRWTLGESAAVMQCDPTVIAAWLVARHYRGHDDCTVVVARRREA
jgi:anti-sigma regulatory factor (Ser/Thr protein kinase)